MAKTVEGIPSLGHGRDDQFLVEVVVLCLALLLPVVIIAASRNKSAAVQAQMTPVEYFKNY